MPRFIKLCVMLLAVAISGTCQAQAVPLHTCGRWIVDSLGQRVKLSAVNWYGASDLPMVVGGLDRAPLAQVAATIRRLGFNAVRLPFANAMLHQQVVGAEVVRANPELAGLSPLEVFDRTIAALTSAGVMVVLDNHQTRAGWCCDAFDGNELWFGENFSFDDWVGDWEFLARRYAGNPMVVGAELRNELRPALLSAKLPLPVLPTWGDGGPLDWRQAATAAGNRILAINPRWLIVVDGLAFGADLSGVATAPVRLDQPNRVVYGAHTYPWFRPTILQSYAELDEAQMRQGLDEQFGYIAALAASAPVWLNEFGDKRQGDRAWWQRLIRYLRDRDLDWAYWPLNGGTTAHGAAENYGLLEADWQTPSDDDRLPMLQTAMPASTGPQIGQALPGCTSEERR